MNDDPLFNSMGAGNKPGDDKSHLDGPETNFVQKGDYFDIRGKIANLQEIMVGAGWDQRMFEKDPLDVDLSCFLLNKSDLTREDGDFVFYNNEKTCEGAIRHQGDSRTGAGDGDDESIIIDLNALPFDIIKIVFVLSIYDGGERDQQFGMVKNLYLRIVNTENSHEIFRFPMPETEYEGEIGIKVGELTREGSKWFFNVMGEPIPGGLGNIATKYGIIIAGQG